MTRPEAASNSQLIRPQKPVQFLDISRCGNASEFCFCQRQAITQPESLGIFS